MQTFEIQDMHCKSCAHRITDALTTADVHARVSVDVAAKRVSVQSALDAHALAQVLVAAGYTAIAVPPSTATAAEPAAKRSCCA